MDANNASEDPHHVLVAMDIDSTGDFNQMPAQTIVVAVSGDSSEIGELAEVPAGVHQIIYRIEPGPSNTSLAVTEEVDAGPVPAVTASVGSVSGEALGAQAVRWDATPPNAVDAPVCSVASVSSVVQDTAPETAAGGCSETKGDKTSAAFGSALATESQKSAAERSLLSLSGDTSNVTPGKGSQMPSSQRPVPNFDRPRGGQRKQQKRQNPSASSGGDMPCDSTGDAEECIPSGQHIVINKMSWHCQQCNETQTFASGKTLDAHLRQKHRIRMPIGNRSGMALDVFQAGKPAKNSEQPDQKTQSLKQQFVQTCDGASHINSKPAAGVDGASFDTYDCQVCNQTFLTAEALETHLGRYTKLWRPPVQCKVCKQKLHTLDQLNIHIFVEHLMDQSTVCLSCGTAFDNYRKLINHMVLMPGMHPDSIGHSAATLLSDALVCLECEKQIAEYKRQLRSACKLKKGPHRSAGKTPVKLNSNAADIVEQPQKEVTIPVQKTLLRKDAEAGTQTVLQRTPIIRKFPIQPPQMNVQQSPEKTVTHQSPEKTVTHQPPEKTTIYQAPQTTYVIQTQPGSRKCLFCDAMLTSDRDQLQHMLQMHSSNFASAQDAELAAGILLDETNVAFTIEMDPAIHDSEPAFASSEPALASSEPCTSDSLDTLKVEQSVFQTPTQAAQTADLRVTVVTPETGFVCDVCGEVLKSKSLMQRHRKTHYPSRIRRSLPFKCDQCKGRYADKDGLEKHKRKHQSLNKACKYCNRKFLTFQGVKNHEKHRHESAGDTSGHFPYECDHCTAKFTKEYSLRDHKTTAHGNSDRHVCHVCGASYSHINTLREHMRFMHENMVYKCEVRQHNLEHYHKWSPAGSNVSSPESVGSSQWVNLSMPGSSAGPY